EAYEVEPELEPVVAEAYEVEPELEPVVAEAYEVEPELEPVVAEAYEVEPELEPVVAGIGAEVSATDQSAAERRFVGTGGPAEATEPEIVHKRSRLERAFQVLRRTALLASDSASVRADLFEIVDTTASSTPETPAQEVSPHSEPADDLRPAANLDSPLGSPASAERQTIVIGQARETTSEPMLTSTSLAADYVKAHEVEADPGRNPFFEEMAAKNEVFSNTMEIDARKLESYSGQRQAVQQQTLRPEARPEGAAVVVTAEPKRRWLRKKRG
nr:hypothetical protein [Actinomycetota bacterium]